MIVLIPFKTSNPKSRLSKLLNEDERREFAYEMLLDVIDAIGDLAKVKVVSPEPLDLDVEVIKDSRGLDECINDRLKIVPRAIIMSDLPLLNKEVLERFFSQPGDVVIAPGRKGGTNMLLVRKTGFRVSYHYGSFLKHIRISKELGYSYKIFDSFFASVDVDDESDILELMIHGKGKRSWKFLRNLGFDVEFARTPRLIIPSN
ncbi:2-phospho-L-lactate guanylyltransferase [Archaeoglobales archaeon]|nr:MAG: 2-phospho-L-lactate guanylyltransferase [Archaeoglobales archaeon ex4484_92]RLI83741.1 MAG: 2-phospho-L-lactate guanylyltransferase [Archaeoglobales archaeon]HDN74095.1 2-phospho-L-lactate guanylyltransferase [Archaeoglobus sp.]